jgi:hypothetical protein
MKQCTECKIIRELTQFYIRKDNNRYFNKCKDCHYAQQKGYVVENKEAIDLYRQEYCKANEEKIKEYSHNWHLENKERRNKNAKNNRIKNIDTIKARLKEQKVLIYKAKDVPCVDCGNKYEPYIMDFDHIDPTTKKFEIARALSVIKTDEEIINEINKCVVRCACCHRDKTYYEAQKLAKNYVVKDKRKQQKRLERMRYVNDIKSQPCCDCKKCYNPWQMDFDHRDKNTKVAKVSKLANGYSLDKLNEEIKKCDLVCVNCHRRRTFGQGRNT